MECLKSFRLPRSPKKIKHDELYVQCLRNYAKIEYGSDWSYALNYMLDNDGKSPKMGMKL